MDQTLVSLTEVEGTRIKMACAKAVFEVKPSRLWKIITDFEHYKDFIPYVAESTVDPVRTKGNITFLTYRLHFMILPYIKDRYFTIKTH